MKKKAILQCVEYVNAMLTIELYLLEKKAEEKEAAWVVCETETMRKTASKLQKLLDVCGYHTREAEDE